jgi:hypothetical protein
MTECDSQNSYKYLQKGDSISRQVIIRCFKAPLCLVVTNHIQPQGKKLENSGLKLTKRNT